MSVVENMEWRHNGPRELFFYAWRLAMLLLPWQIRWFHEGLPLGGLPWEGGRWSIYLAWFPMVVSIVAAFVGKRYRAYTSVFLLAVYSTFSIFLSTYSLATAQWWLEVCLLLLFVWVTITLTDRETVAHWVVYAIFPHILLGIWQSVTQQVIGSTWLGMAHQLPATKGVSVVEMGGQRWLRAYGGFPHPNIFAGWIVVAMAAAVSSLEYRFLRAKKHLYEDGWSIFFVASIFLFSLCLILTFSRSAWVAFGFLLLYLGWGIVRSRHVEIRRRLLWVFLVIVAGIVVSATWKWPLMVTRTLADTRLEQRSVDERVEGWRNGIHLFWQYPWFGVGPRATGYTLIQEGIVPVSRAPILPHNIFLLMLDELGIFGVCLLLWFSLHSLFRRGQYRSFELGHAYSIFLLFPLAFFDHYLWSTWSGLTLLMLTFSLFFAQE